MRFLAFLAAGRPPRVTARHVCAAACLAVGGAIPGMAQQPDSALREAAMQYLRATSRADSLRYGDSALAIARALMRRQPMNRQLGRQLLAGFADVADWPVVLALGQIVTGTDSTLVDTLYLRQLFTAYGKLGRSRQAARMARSLVRQQTPPHPRVVRAVFVAFGNIQDWSNTVTFGRILAQIDPTVRTDEQYRRRTNSTVDGRTVPSLDDHRHPTTAPALRSASPSLP